MKSMFTCTGCKLFLAGMLLLAFLTVNCKKASLNNPGSIVERGFDWKAFSGTHITVLLNKHPWSKVLLAHKDEFYKMTGIAVDYEEYTEEQFREKQLVDLMSGIPGFDVSMIMPGQSLLKFVKEGWLMPLDSFLLSKSMFYSGFEIADIYEQAMDTGKHGGICYAIPFLYETSLLAYNKSLFRQYGISPPGTMQELEAACRLIYEKSGNSLYGITLRGKGNTATSQWVDFLYSFGGEWLDAGRAAVAAPAAVEATAFYGRLLRLYGPKDAYSNSWPESISLFTAGKAAMIYDANTFYMYYEDPLRSKIAGNVGYTQIPAGPAGSIPHFSTWALAISARTNNKEAAWYFIQWTAGKEMALGQMQLGLPATRASAWNSINTAQGLDPGWISASQASYAQATSHWNPEVQSVAECRDAMGKAIVASILGRNVEDACSRAALEIDDIIRGDL